GALVHVQNLRHLRNADPGLARLGVGATLQDAVHGDSAAANLPRIAVNEPVLGGKKIFSSSAANCFPHYDSLPPVCRVILTRGVHRENRFGKRGKNRAARQPNFLLETYRKAPRRS